MIEQPDSVKNYESHLERWFDALLTENFSECVLAWIPRYEKFNFRPIINDRVEQVF